MVRSVWWAQWSTFYLFPWLCNGASQFIRAIWGDLSMDLTFMPGLDHQQPEEPFLHLAHCLPFLPVLLRFNACCASAILCLSSKSLPNVLSWPRMILASCEPAWPSMARTIGLVSEKCLQLQRFVWSLAADTRSACAALLNARALVS